MKNKPEFPIRMAHAGARWTLGAALLLAACNTEPEPPPARSLTADLSGSTEGFASALAPRALVFPSDHGAHPDYKHEWWYVTGNLSTATGRRFGYQFTIFRSAVLAAAPASASRWTTNQLYLGHAAVADIETGRFYSDERYARGALDLAGARAAPLQVWLEDWQMKGNTACPSCISLRLRVSGEKFAFELRLESVKPLVLHGDRGLSAKSATPGNASYYYSFTRLASRGEITLGDERFKVAGNSWFDHEWSTSALEAEQTGWDWFSLQLSDDTELMLFRLRHRADRGRDFLYGSVVDATGGVTPLAADSFEIHVLGRWRSSLSGVVYPARWRLAVPQQALVIDVEPLMAAQEMAHSFRYWEGAVAVTGKRAGRTLTGQGYVELTGYDGEQPAAR